MTLPPIFSLTLPPRSPPDICVRLDGKWVRAVLVKLDQRGNVIAQVSENAYWTKPAGEWFYFTEEA